MTSEVSAFGVAHVSKIAPRLVYHGTSEVAAKKIARSGIKISRSGQLGHGVYVTDDAFQAATYAQGRSRGGSPGRRLRFMAVGPALRNGEREATYRASQLIPDGKRSGKKVTTRSWGEHSGHLGTRFPGERRWVLTPSRNPEVVSQMKKNS